MLPNFTQKEIVKAAVVEDVVIVFDKKPPLPLLLMPPLNRKLRLISSPRSATGKPAAPPKILLNIITNN